MASPNVAFSSGQVLTASQTNNFPFGVCGYQELTTNFATTGTHTNWQDNGMTLTITEISGRYYRVTAYSNPYPSGGLQGVNFRIVRGSTSIKQGNYSANVMDTGTALPVVFTYVYKSTASGSATFKVQIQAPTANTAVNDYADATFPRQFVIEDIGIS